VPARSGRQNGRQAPSRISAAKRKPPPWQLPHGCGQALREVCAMWSSSAPTPREVSLAAPGLQNRAIFGWSTRPHHTWALTPLATGVNTSMMQKSLRGGAAQQYSLITPFTHRPLLRPSRCRPARFLDFIPEVDQSRADASPPIHVTLGRARGSRPKTRSPLARSKRVVWNTTLLRSKRRELYQ